MFWIGGSKFTSKNAQHSKLPKPQSPSPLLPYDFKVDVYSAGVGLHFISCYPVKDNSNLNLKVKAMTGGQRDVKESIYHKDDDNLYETIIQTYT